MTIKPPPNKRGLKLVGTQYTIRSQVAGIFRQQVSTPAVYHPFLASERVTMV